MTQTTVALACVVSLAACLSLQKLPPSVWGGTGLQLEITPDAQTIEFSCAHGNIDQPIEPAADGKFDVKGTYTREAAGPERADRPNKPEPARYSGRVQDGTMTLTITLTESKEVVDTYTLTKDKRTRIFKCR